MRWWTREELGDPPEQVVPAGARDARAYAGAVTAVIVTVHLIAAGIWFGGSTALVFVGVPAIRTLEGEPRGRAMKELGLRWRPLGYGALLVAALTGIVLAAREWDDSTSFRVVLL